MTRRSLLCVIFVLATGLAGCTAPAEPKPPTPPAALPAAAMRLVAFDSCQRLAADLRVAAELSVGPWGFPGDSNYAMDDTMSGGARTALAPNAKQAAVPGPAFSGTNVHEQGVDEPDIVKTDGRRIVTVSGGTLRVVDAVTRQLTGKLAIGGEGGEVQLLISGDRALVFLPSGFGRHPMAKPVAPTDDGAQVLLVDLAGTPRLISRYRGTGTLVDARQTGSTARVVLRSTPRIVFPERPNLTDEKARIAANRKTIAKAPVTAWLPSWSVTTGSTTDTGTLGCGQVSRPSEYSGTGLLTILTFDLGAAELGAGAPVSIVADGDTVYGNGTSLYVANDQRWRIDLWRGRPNPTLKQQTEIYRFETSGTGPPVYAAAGTVQGWLLNQYALSEWDGYLRVATTDESAGKSAVRVLQRRGDTLVQVGAVDGLGKGERIYSVRFIGPRGYVVTFKQTDPLYSLDLSDPAQPKVTGQLKITGYSAHLQPAGDGRLIGIGQGADKRGVTEGTQISLFDVSDPAAPRLLAQHQVPGGHSDAEWDPHALLWWPQTKLLVVPMTVWGLGIVDAPNAAMALRVTDDAVKQVGMVAQPRGATVQDTWNAGVRRTLVIDGTLWTMSDAGLQASDISTLKQVGWVPNR